MKIAIVVLVVALMLTIAALYGAAGMAVSCAFVNLYE